MLRFVLAAAVVAGMILGVALRPVGPPPRSAEAAAPAEPLDAGTGEVLLVLVAGEFSTREEAEAANARYAFGDVRGFVVAPTADFERMTPGRWALVTAFRTLAGAREFEPVARAAGARVRRVVTRYTGTAWIGLGQEPHPNGLGPLRGPLPPGHPARLDG